MHAIQDHADASPPATEAEGGAPALPGHELVGRLEECQVLEAGLQDAARGRGRLLLVGGEPGIGKSRLAEEIAGRAAARDGLALWGRCWEGGGAPAYWPWVQILRAAAKELEPAELDRLIGRHGPTLAQIAPELSGDAPDAAHVPSGPAQEPQTEHARFYLFDAVTQFLLRLAARHRPTVLVLDDLHAADRTSLLLLQFLARELRRASILILACYRDDEARAAPAVADALGTLARDGHLVRLHGLQPSAVAELIQRRTGTRPTDGLVAMVHDTTEGNPFFVDEIVQLLSADGRLRTAASLPTVALPDEIRSTIRRRLEPLEPDAREVLSVASVIGRAFDVALVSAVMERPVADILEQVGAAAAAGVVALTPDQPGQFAFSHALVRETLYGDLTPARRVRLHQSVGQTLERRHPIDPEPYLPELAHHFYQAAPGGDARRAVDYALWTARRAASRLAYEEAMAQYQRALELASRAGLDDAERIDCMLAHGEVLARAGNEPEARDEFLRAAALSRRLGDSERLARAALGVAGEEPRAGIVDDDANRLLGEALARLPEEFAGLRARLLGRLAMGRYYTASLDERDALTAEALVIARGLDDRGCLAEALLARRFALWGPDNLSNQLEVAGEIVSLAEQEGDLELAARGIALRATVLLARADVAGADLAIARHTQLAERLHQPGVQVQALSFTIMRAVLAGRLADAEAQIEDLAALSERYGSSGEAGAPVANVALVRGVQLFALRREQGRLSELEPAVRAYTEAYPLLAAWKSALALVLSECGRPAEASALVDELAARDFDDIPRDGNFMVVLSHLAEVAHALGDRTRALRLYELLSPYDGQQVVVGEGWSVRGAVAHYLGLLALTHRETDAVKHLEDALATHRAMGARLLAARGQRALARALHDHGDADTAERARSLLARARAGYLTAGLPQHAAAVDQPPRPGQAPAAADRAPGARPERTAAAGAAPAAPDRLFLHEGDYWTVAFGGIVGRVKDLKGMRYLAELLEQPDTELHALQLAGAKGPGRQIATGAGTGLHVDQSSAGPLLDADAKRAYGERITELGAEIEEAAAFHDDERRARAEEELDFLKREIVAAVGLGGRDRRSTSDAERARQNVTRAIKSAIERIRKANPALATHLAAAVHTGTYCCYTPDPAAPVAWQVRPR